MMDRINFFPVIFLAFGLKPLGAVQAPVKDKGKVLHRRYSQSANDLKIFVCQQIQKIFTRGIVHDQQQIPAVLRHPLEGLDVFGFKKNFGPRPEGRTAS